MKQLIFMMLLIAGMCADAQQTTIIRRIKSKTETTPASDTIQGKVWTDSTYVNYSVLRYVGKVNLDSLWKKSNRGSTGYSWVYIPASAVVAKVMDVRKTGVDTFSVSVDRRVPGIVNQPIKSIVERVYAYTLHNDGDTTGTINGVIIKNGQQLDFPYSWLSGTNAYWQEPLIVGAPLTDFLIIEKH
jgi:hypothetical protein